MDGNPIGSNSRNIVAHQLVIQQGPGQASYSKRVTIGSLPNEVLLEIFDFYQISIDEDESEFLWSWEKLVHVCRRWRYLIFASPIRLNLQLFCTQNSPVRSLLDIWPPFPLTIQFEYPQYPQSDTIQFEYPQYPQSEWDSLEDTFDNFVAALEHCDRIHEIDILVADPPDSLREHIATAMESPFTELRTFSLEFMGVEIRLPDTFLNGSVTSLQDLSLSLGDISFPSLPRLLLSTSNLRFLHLDNIPDYGYFPPETLATSLSALSKLESLVIHFTSTVINLIPTPRSNRAPPPPTLFVLPALTELEFTGTSEYLEALATRFEAPILDDFRITFHHQHDFDIPQTLRFFDHLKCPRPSSLALNFSSPREAEIRFPITRYPPSPYSLHIRCVRLEGQVVSVALVCSQILPILSNVELLIIESGGWWVDPNPDMESMPWLQILRSFPSVRRLAIAVKLEPFIAFALQGLAGESAAEVLPSLRSLSIIGRMSNEPAQQGPGLQSFITARQHSGHPIAVSRIRMWES